jgi:hypothetical protein
VTTIRASSSRYALSRDTSCATRDAVGFNWWKSSGTSVDLRPASLAAFAFPGVTLGTTTGLPVCRI